MRLTSMCLFMLLISLCSTAAHAKYNILFIHSYDTQHKWTQFITEGFEARISTRSDIVVFNEYMDAKRFPRSEYQNQFYSYLSEKYENHNIDYIVTSDDPALNLVLRNSGEAFHKVPIIFMGVNLVTQTLLNRDGVTGVFENRDLESTVLDIKQTFNTDDLIVITDNSSSGKSNLEKINKALRNPSAPSNVKIITKMNVSEVSTKFAALPADTPILLVGQLFDDLDNNQLMTWTGGVRLLSDTLENPVISIAIITLEYGATAAHELNGQRHAGEAANLLLRLINGENINDINEITKQKSIWYFNWQQMKTHRLSSDALPKDTILMFEDISFFDENRKLIVGFSSALLIALVIIGLLLEIVRRSKNEKIMLADNETRYRDLALEGANIFWETDSNEYINYMSGDISSILNIELKVDTNNSIGDKTTIKQLLKKTDLVEFPWSAYNQCLVNQQSIPPMIAKYKLADKSIAVISISAKARFDNNNDFVGHRGIIKEITGEYELTEKIAFEASHDSLTGLYNRRVFNDRFKEIASSANISSNDVYVCYLDLDNFKAVNDSIGHLAGDGMLADIAELISNNISRNDILARLGGDEFGLLIMADKRDDAIKVCERLIKEVKAYKLRWNQSYYSVGLSIGIVPVSNKLTHEELLSHADIACYKAKERGRGSVYYSSIEDTEITDEQARLGYIANINHALESNQFFFAKQLIKPLYEASEIPHYEILLRYRDQYGKLVPPGLFIPTAEKHGVITLIDKWVIKHVIHHYKDLFPNENPVVSVNVSGISLSTTEFLNEVKSLLATTNFDVSKLCIEITETAVVSHISKAIDFIGQLKPLGCKFSLDDFGSGSSSYGYLKQLPVDYLKIDGSLIKSIENEFIDKAIVKSINEIAHKMNIKTVAEYIENDNIMQIVKEIGIDYGQGYGIHKPENCIGNNT